MDKDPKEADKPEDAVADEQEVADEAKEATDKIKPETTEAVDEEATETADKKDNKTDNEAKEEVVDEVAEKTEEVEEDSGEFKLELEQEAGKSKKVPMLFALLLVIAAAVGVWWFMTQRSTDVENDESTTTADTQTSYEQGAALTYVDGDVEYYYALAWTDVAPGENLRQGDQVRTGENSKAIITLDDGSAIRLDASTSITLTTLMSDEVVVTNESGSVYARVSDSTVRSFDVVVGEQSYTALGTAYKTTNTSKEEGVEVYQSEVKVDEETTIKEGKEYYTKHSDSKKVAKSTDIDLTKLGNDEFVNWNKTEDEKDTNYSKKLGVLKDIKKEEPKEEPEPAPAPSTPSAKITVSATKTDDGIKVSWTNSGIYAGDGYKVVFDKNDTTPSYGQHSAKYVDKNTSSKVLPLQDGKTWHIRVCAYRPSSGSCASYSNSVSKTAPLVEKEPVTRGEMSGSITEGLFSWSYTGNAPHGYKVVWNKTGSPKYGVDSSKLVGGSPLNLNDKITEAGDYFISVCAYTAGTESEACVDYLSPDLTFTRL